jgi:iron complex outermembrane receptor protein
VRFANPRIDLTTSFFTFFNQDISRRNPLYNDPVFDANDTQPQLVSAGQERFTGGKIEGRWQPVDPLRLTLRGTYVRAITTASPDLPEEVGREITRFPPFNLSASARYGFSRGWMRGLSLSASFSYISDFVAQYEDARRHRLDYPEYTITSLSANYSKRIGKLTHGFGLSVRNLFDTDLLEKLHRLGAGREFSASYRLMW